MTKKQEKKGARGRPSSFKPEYAEQARKLCLLGATDKDLADFFGYSEQTINAWKDKHPEFLEALKSGKSVADARVERALFERAVGYSHPEDKIFIHNGKPVVVPTTKHFAPDAVSCIFWLKNRMPDKWRDKPEPQPTEDEQDIGEEYTLHTDSPVPDEPVL